MLCFSLRKSHTEIFVRYLSTREKCSRPSLPSCSDAAGVCLVCKKSEAGTQGNGEKIRHVYPRVARAAARSVRWRSLRTRS